MVISGRVTIMQNAKGISIRSKPVIRLEREGNLPDDDGNPILRYGAPAQPVSPSSAVSRSCPQQTSGDTELKEPDAPRTGGRPVILHPESDTVNSPFVADGTHVGAKLEVFLRRISDNQRFEGTPVTPPQGSTWAFEFEVPGDDYRLYDVESAATYTVDPLHVV